MAEESPTYTINIPGLTDVFSYKTVGVYNPELKRERIQRMKTSESPIPEPLRWIPKVINKLDDAQDLVYTAAYLAKPLLRRLPARFIPYVGWGLLAMDIVDLTNFILSLAMTPRISKRKILTTGRKILRKKRPNVAAFESFIQKGGWRGHIGFAIQAGQAATTLTGYGLSLGAIMGSMSDAVWGAIRKLQGERVIIKGPPPSDPAAKAARFLMQTHSSTEIRDILSLEDHQLLIAAHNIAVGIMLEQQIPIDEDRIEILGDTRTALFEPWEESTLQALAEEGITDFSNMRDYTTVDDETVTYGSAIMRAIDEEIDWQTTIRSQIEPNETWQVWYEIWTEAGRDIINYIFQTKDEDYLTYDSDDVMAAHVANCTFMPATELSKDTMYQWLTRAKEIATAMGMNYPTCSIWEAAAKELGIPLKDKV